MYEDKNKKPGGGKKIEGSYKKKGAAQESDAQEAKNLVDDTPAQNEMKSGAGKGKKDHKKVAARKKGAAQYKEEGAADFKGGLHAKNTKHSESGEHLGAKRMGFTQNFGAARQNSYAQGAAKVASIMSFGASKKKGAADHEVGKPIHSASEVKLDNITPSGGVKTSYGKQSIRNLIKSQGEYDTNTTQVSQNLAEIDSLKMVASGQGKKAESLYSLRSNLGGPSGGTVVPYTSDKPLLNNPEKTFVGNNSVQNRIKNNKKLREEAKIIQGPRPTL